MILINGDIKGKGGGRRGGGGGAGVLSKVLMLNRELGCYD